MYELMVAAESFSDKEKYDLMKDCNRYFFDKKESGMTEEEIIEGLPKPKLLAAAYRAGEPFGTTGDDIEEETSGGISPLSVFVFSLLIPVCGVYELLAFVLGLTAAVLMLALCVAAAFLSVACFGVSTLSHGFILIGIGGLFATVALVLFSCALFKAIIAAFKWFPSYMNRTLHNKRGGRKL